MAQRLVEIIGDVFGETALHQMLLRIAGDHDHRDIGLPGGFAHAARQGQAVAIGQRQRGGDQIHRAGFQRLTRFGNVGTADHLHIGQVALEHVGNQLAHQLGAIDHHHARRVADQVFEIWWVHGRPQVSVGRVWRRKWPVTSQAPNQPRTKVPTSTIAECNRSSPCRVKELP